MIKIFPFLLLLFGCASIQSLEGGAKDETPPQLVKSLPDSAQINYTYKTISLQFDEYVKLQDVNNLLIISPSQKNNPKITLKGKKVDIELQDTLLTNTTYTIAFNGSIVDNNESNPYTDKLVFSTGSYIDSLYYSGYATQFETKEPCEQCYILLYTNSVDSNILQNKPNYITKTNSAGRFLFTNLPPLQFQAICLKDDNRNFKLEPNELASLYTTIYPDTTESYNDSLSVFTYRTYIKPNLKIVNTSTPGYAKIALSEPAYYSYTLSSNQKITYQTINTSRDTLQVLYDLNNDSTEFKLITPLDTIKAQTNSSLQLKKLQVQIEEISGTSITLRTNANIGTIQNDRIQLLIDSLAIKLDSTTITNNYIHLHFSAPLNFEKNIQLIIDSAFITNTTGSINLKDTLSLPRIPQSSPKLYLVFQPGKISNYIIQIVNKQQVMKEFNASSDTTLILNSLSQGSYYVRIITDINENNYWDSGNPITNQSPEPIYISETFELRNNWDKELIINYL
jgi:hypothetical protein